MGSYKYAGIRTVESKMTLGVSTRSYELESTCGKYYRGGKVRPKNCMFCEQCIHNYEFLCILCGHMHSYAGANLMDMICSQCMKVYFGCSEE